MLCAPHKGTPLPHSPGQLDDLANGDGASLIPEREPPQLGDVLKLLHADGLLDLDAHNGDGVALDELDLKLSFTAGRLSDRLGLSTRKALLLSYKLQAPLAELSIVRHSLPACVPRGTC